MLDANLSKNVPVPTQMIEYMQNILSLAKWTNRRDRFRYIGDKLDKKFYPFVAVSSFITVSVAAAVMISTLPNLAIKGLVGSGLAGLFVTLARTPNLLYGNGRYHGFTRGRKVVKDVLAFIEMCHLVFSIENLVKELKKNHTTTKITSAELKHMEKISSEIKKVIETMKKRGQKRNKVSTYAKLYQQTAENNQSERRLGRITRKVVRSRVAQLDEEFGQLAAFENASKQLKEIIGSAWEDLAYLIDPKKKPPKTERVEEFGREFESLSSGILVPAGTEGRVCKYNLDKNLGEECLNPALIKWIGGNFRKLDFPELLKKIENLVPQLERLAQPSRELPPPECPDFSIIDGKGSDGRSGSRMIS
jgi:hypothetical protein